MVVCPLWGTLGITLRYLLWIWRERHGGKFLAHVVLHPPSIKLSVTCVYVLFMVAICPNFQIFEDYGTNKWTLKHTISFLKVFAKTTI